MKNSIFNAVCKTRYLALLVVFIFTCGNVWGETITLTQSALSLTGSYTTNTTKTVSNVDFTYTDLMKNKDNIQAKASSGTIYNSSLVPGKITKVQITSTGTGRQTTIAMGTSTSNYTAGSYTGNGGIYLNGPANTCCGYFKITRGSNAAYWTKVEVTYTPATITLSKSSISGLDYAVGGGPSAAQTFTVSGSNIPANLTVTAPTNFEVSLDGSSWASSKTINVTLTGSASAGTLSSTTVYVRLASGKSAGNYSGNVSIAMAGCKTISSVNPKTVAVSGTVSAASCSTKPELNGAANNGTVSSSSIPVKCTGITSIGANCSLTSYGFVWAPTATTTEPTLNNSNHEVGTSIATSTEFSYTITGLNASTSYTIRSYATNGNGTQYGSAYTVTTLAACTAAPTVGAGSSSNVTKNSATVTCSAGITSLGTGGCAIESYGFAYGTSANPTISGTKSEVGTEYTTTGTSFTATLTGLTEGQTYYVRPYATNGYGTAYGDQVTFGTPKITIDPASLVVAFGDRKVGGSYTATFTVSGVNLQGNITLTPSSGCSGIFSIDQNSITPTDRTVTNKVITITYTPTTAGSHGNPSSVYINVASDGAQTKSVTPTGTGKWEVTWNNNGSTSTTLVANNEKPTFPSTPSSCDATSTTFYGWATAPWTNKIQSLEGKTVHIANSTMSNITANGTTFYAVFAKSSGSEGSASVATDALKSAVSTVTSYTNVNFNITDAGSNNYQCSAHAIKCTSNGSQKDFMQVGKIGDNRYITIPTLPGNITNISSTTIYGTSGGFSGTIYYNTSASTTNAIATTGSLSGANSFSMDVTNGGTSGYLMFSTALCLGQLTISYSSASYSDYLTTCCENKVTLSAGSPSNGTVVFSPTGPLATCSATNSDRQTTVTVTPNAGYKLTGWTKAVSGIALPDSTNAISTSSDNTAAQSNTYTFAQNANGSMTVTATFTTMVDHFIDKLHNKTGYTESDNHAESGVYTVPNPGDASTPSPGDESCEDVHYKFVGWVPSSDVNATTGAVTSTANMIYDGTTGHAASDVTYWAVWAKEE